MVACTDVAYDVAGTTYVGRLARPEGEGAERRPGVLIAHEGNGLDDRQKARAERFVTELGVVAFALDYYGGGRPLADRSEINDRLGRLSDDPVHARALATAALDVLRAERGVDETRLAAVGYCFGGSLVLELARTGAPLRGVVAFHPGLYDRRNDNDRITGSVLVCLGSDDPIIPMSDRLAFEDELRVAGVDWQVHVHGGARHSFTNPDAGAAGIDALAYDERSDRRSWRAMVDFLDEVLG